MSQKLEMKLNPLPAKTWNWLHMNGAIESAVLSGQPGHLQVERPESVTVMPWQDGADGEPVKGARIQTGLGGEFSEFLRQGDLVGQLFMTTAGKKEEEPLRLNFCYKDGEAVQNQIGLYLWEGSELTLLMDFSSAKENGGEAAVQLKIWAERDARLHLVQVQHMGQRYTFYNDIGADCQDASQIEVLQLVLGGGRTYLGSRAALSGTEAAWNSDVGYLVGENERLDMNFVAHHTGRKTVSRMDAAGVLRGNARKLFRGTIDFRRGAAGAVGNEKEDVLLLDEAVVNQTIPLILCEEEDVEGNHGATIGKLDEKLLFYLESRGIPTAAVYEMMARARIEALSSRIPDEKMRRLVEAQLDISAAE